MRTNKKATGQDLYAHGNMRLSKEYMSMQTNKKNQCKKSGQGTQLGSVPSCAYR